MANIHPHTFIYKYIEARTKRGAIALASGNSAIGSADNQWEDIHIGGSNSGTWRDVSALLSRSPTESSLSSSSSTLISYFNSIPSILFLQGRHVALRNGSHATDRSAKVLRYANKMRPIRSSCATLITNTNWFVQSNPFVIFILFFFSSASLLLIYSVYILRVCRISMLCLLSLLSLMQRCLYTLYTHPTATVWMLVCGYVFYRVKKRISLATTNQQ